MSHFYGSLIISMFVTMPSGRDKRVKLATIHCEYAEREAVYRKFVDDNGSRLLKADCYAEFVVREFVNL